MSIENTVDYAGYALTTTGTPLTDRPVTLKRTDTLATVASTTTDANGKWLFNDIAPSPLVKAEISAGTTPQIAVKSCWSGDVWSIYVREKLTVAPAALVNLPPLANIYLNSVLLTTALDSRYVNVSGDTIAGTLTVTGATNLNGGVGVTGASTLNGAVNVGTTLTVTGVSNLNGGVAVTGASTLNGAVSAASLSVAGATTLAATTLSAPLTLPTGSGAAPSLTFAGDSNTGIYRIGPDNVGVAVGGALVLNLGINAMAVQGDVVVNGMVHVTNALVAQGIFNHDGSALGFYGAGGYPKQTVTGSRGSNAALTSLLSALATLGLITNSSS